MGRGAAASMGRGVTSARPRRDEVEVTLFGPGYGESVVVHAGVDDWLVVDSCLDADGETAAWATCAVTSWAKRLAK